MDSAIHKTALKAHVFKHTRKTWFQNTVFFLNLFFKPVRHLLLQSRYLRSSRVRNWNSFPKRSSETLFIMGSGGSIAAYPARRFEEIQNNDSIGFNFWMLHEMVPTYYVAELLPNSQRSLDLLVNLTRRAEDYQNVTVILKDSPTLQNNIQNIPATFKNVYISSQLNIPGNDDARLAKWLRLLDRLGLFSGNAKKGLFLYRQASLSWLMVFAILQGYQNIVLCGVDLITPEYFYEIDSRYCVEKNLRIPPPEFEESVHPTLLENLSSGKLPIDRILTITNRELLQPREVRLFTGSKKTILHPMLPRYEWASG
jgi:hypothetical protein